MKPSKKEQLIELTDDLQNELDEIRVYGSAEAARSAVVTAAQILALLEDVE